MNNSWKAGAASTVITPTESMWLAGWAARREPASKTAQDLFTRAVALEDASGERIVIVTADLIAIPATLAEAVAARAKAEWKLNRGHILFNASHTHTGPEVRPDKVPFFEIPTEFAAKIGPYAKVLELKILRAIEMALAKLEPASLWAYSGSVGFAKNRRSPDGPVDHDVPALTVTNRHGNPLAFLFGYACHNLTLPPTFNEFHGDYSGVAQRALEEKFPGAIALCLSGAGADQDPSPRGTLELAQLHGKALTEAIGNYWRAGGQEVSSRLRIAYEEVELPLQPVPSLSTLQAEAHSEDMPRRRKAEFLLNAIAQGRPLPTHVLCPIQVLRFGEEAMLIALGGEPVIDYALTFKRQFAGPLVWVAGYSNAMFGYLPTRQILQAGGYEGGRATLWSALPAPLHENAEAIVTESVSRMVRNIID